MGSLYLPRKHTIARGHLIGVYRHGYLPFVVVNFSLPERQKRPRVSPHHTGNAWAIDRGTAKATTWGSSAKESSSSSTWPTIHLCQT